MNEDGDVGLYSDPLIRQTSMLTYHLVSSYPHNFHLFVVPAHLSMTVGTIISISIFISWTSAGSEVGSYEVMWSSDKCPGDIDEGSAIVTKTSYNIGRLREGTRYTITVSATSSAGTSSSDPVSGETEELGECSLL